MLYNFNMLDTLWLMLIIYIVFLGLYFSKKINFKNYELKSLTRKINKDSLFLALGTKMGVGTIIGTTMSIFIGGAGIITPELNFARHSCGVHRFFLFRLGADVDIRRLPLYVRPMLSGSICLDKLMF